MNVVDWIALVYLALGLLAGWRRGLLALALIIAGYFVSYLVAQDLYMPLAHAADLSVIPAVAKIPGGQALTGVAPGAVRAVTFVLVMLVADVVVSIIASRFVGVNRLPVVGGLNRAGGALLGLAEHAFIVAILMYALVSVLGGPLAPVQNLILHSKSYAEIGGAWKPPFLVP